MIGAAAERMLDDMANRLFEHFDAVQILATWCEDGTTKHSSRGAGNWYARQGMAHEFITRSEAYDQAVAISEQLNGEQDD